MRAKVYFLLPYAERIAPSQRFRIEAYYDSLDKKGIRYKVGHFWSREGNLALYKKGNVLGKALNLGRGFVRRGWQVLTGLKGVEFVLIHREAAPLGPPLLEWMIARVFRKKIIYDFDDAIWIASITDTNRLAVTLKASWKVKYICKWAYKVSAGNDYLGRWAAQYNPNVVYNPTCVDMEKRYNAVAEQDAKKVTIGWTGSHSTLKYLERVKPVLEELEKDHEFEFLVICDQPPNWQLRSLRFIPWKEATEIRDLLKINIGVMPLEQDAWSEGKCGFKIIQYLSLGIPAVASPIGVNKQLICPGENGYLCETAAEWKAALETLLHDADLRKTMGAAGSKKMWNGFSTQANEANFISLFS